MPSMVVGGMIEWIGIDDFAFRDFLAAADDVPVGRILFDEAFRSSSERKRVFTTPFRIGSQFSLGPPCSISAAQRAMSSPMAGAAVTPGD
jgi:hypothetical protein